MKLVIENRPEVEMEPDPKKIFLGLDHVGGGVVGLYVRLEDGGKAFMLDISPGGEVAACARFADALGASIFKTDSRGRIVIEKD